ncbi:MAG: HD domain-containing protein [Chitinophagaceae bacterium]|nr:MAG: HD domain-containing protein [Chitinophagaceae bacterium]
MEDILEKIKRFADGAHGTQLRKYTPERYIVHPIRVMEICKQYTQEHTVLGAALLHDVLEDTPTTKDQLYDFLRTLLDEKQAAKTVALVVELSDVYVKSDYPQLNRKQRKAKEAERIQLTSAEAQTIKYADIIDNCKEIVKYDRQFAPIFLRECLHLLTIMERGNPVLRKIALDQLINELKRLT